MTTVARAIARNNVRTLGPSSRPTLLFAHGFGCDQHMWRRVLPAFTERYHVVVFDHVGSGRSDPDAWDATRYSTLDGYADDVIAICDQLDLHEVTLVGHSVSAMIAVTAAARRPDLFVDLVLVAPSPCYVDHPEDGYVGGFTRADVDGLLRSLRSNYFAWAAAMAPMVMGGDNPAELGDELAGRFCRTDPDRAAQFAAVTFLSDSRAVLPHVTTPSLIMQCADDALAPAHVGDHLHQHLAGSTLVRLRATGHCPHVSAPEETAAAMLAYVERAR